MKCNFLKLSVLLMGLVLLTFSACQKNFDRPPVGELPDLIPNTTIQQAIDLVANTTSPVSLEGKVLKAVVIADDESGNFYKQLVVQDSTAGIRIDIDEFDLYETYPIGREVYIKGDGLFVWMDGDVAAIIGSSNTNDSRIDGEKYRLYLLGGAYNQPVTPRVRDLLTLTSADYNTLVQLNNVEINACDAGSNFGYPNQSRNVDMTECATGGNIIMRNSGFATFANDRMPTGNGAIIAVFNSFRGTSQLFIRSPEDVSSMTGTRCTSRPTYQSVSITNLRAQFPANSVATGKIRGIVISDSEYGQWQGRNLVIQEPNGSGITLRFNDDHFFSVGDYVEVGVEGGTLGEYQDLLQVSDLPLCRAVLLANPGQLKITPRVASVSDLNANSEAWESTLIQVQNATFSTTGFFDASNIAVNDGTGSVAFFSRFLLYSDFTPIPTGTGTVTAVMSENNGNTQLLMRYYTDLADFSGSGGGGGGGGGPLLLLPSKTYATLLLQVRPHFLQVRPLAAL